MFVCRMLSNRESARRSRRRKQEHLQMLEVQIVTLLKEKKTWVEEKEKLERRCEVAEIQISHLKDENARLRDELRILGMVVSVIHSSHLNLDF